MGDWAQPVTGPIERTFVVEANGSESCQLRKQWLEAIDTASDRLPQRYAEPPGSHAHAGGGWLVTILVLSHAILCSRKGPGSASRFSLNHSPSGLGFLRLRCAPPTADRGENGLVRPDRS
jgi:hypothetical protein